MASNISTVLGNLASNESNWLPVNVYNNLTSRISPSGNLQYLNSTLPGLDADHTYLRYNNTISGFGFSQGSVTGADSYFRPNVFSYNGACTYPISGQYGFLNRLLFYLLMIFALIARRRTWLAAAALGTAMTYAASAAVHAFALLARYNYDIHEFDDSQRAYDPDAYGDLDLQGLFPVLVASCIMLTPILNWSIEIREHARAVAVYWGLLMFTALVPTLYKVFRGIVPFLDYDQLVTCEVNASAGCTLDAVVAGDGQNLVSSNFYNRCNCNDTCGAASPRAPFRKDQGLQAFLVSDSTYNLNMKDSVSVVYVLNFVFLCFIIVHGVLGILEVQYTQAELRNRMFVWLAGKAPYSDRSGLASKVRFRLAKFMASSFFIGAIVAAVICPAIFVSSVIINEIVTWGYPVGERADGVGQWSTYVGAAFVLIGAIIQRYHLAWRHALILSLSKTKELIEWIFTGGKTKFPLGGSKNERTKDNSILQNIGDFLKQCARPFTHAIGSMSRSWRRVREEWTDFKLWWRDPIDRCGQPHFRFPEKRSSFEPLAYNPLALHRSGTLPTSFSEEHSSRPFVVRGQPSDHSLSPLMPQDGRLAFPPATVIGLSSPDPGEHGNHDTFQRHPFERRASGL